MHCCMQLKHPVVCPLDRVLRRECGVERDRKGVGTEAVWAFTASTRLLNGSTHEYAQRSFKV